jgi:hypothetical protein
LKAVKELSKYFVVGHRIAQKEAKRPDLLRFCPIPDQGTKQEKSFTERFLPLSFRFD